MPRERGRTIYITLRKNGSDSPLHLCRAREVSPRLIAMDLSTRYLGLDLRTPLVPSASPLSHDIEHIQQMEESGASAIVLHSLFAEQLRSERTQAYLRHLKAAKASVHVPIIASLNTSTPVNWAGLARSIEDAGADALELNVYAVPTDPELSGEAIEQTHLTVLRAVKAEVSIPVAMKLSPYFSNLANFARQLDDAGADGLVLFNRFYQPDLDLENLSVTSNILFSNPSEARLPMRWIALLYGRIRADLGATTGIHDGVGALKMVLAGADVAMICSALLERGIMYLRVIEQQMRAWLEEHEYQSLQSLKGLLSQQHCKDPSAYERSQYVHALTTWVTS